tara:strand:- start:4569 stop:5243 length:675 start_codon:yes stop_codon:yes gene_type:complete
MSVSRRKGSLYGLGLALYLLLGAFAIRSTPWVAGPNGGPSAGFKLAAAEATSSEILGPAVFKVLDTYASPSLTGPYVDNLANAEERRQSDLPLAQFVHCQGDFLCDPQGRLLSWIIPVAIPVPLPANVNIYVVARALAQDGQPNNPLILLDRVSLIGPAHNTPDCRLSDGGAASAHLQRRADAGWTTFQCSGPPLLTSTLAHWIINGCHGLEVWEPCAAVTPTT